MMPINLRAACTLLLTALIAACGQQSESGSSANAQPVGGTSGQELAAEQILHVGLGAELQSLDPQRGQDVQGADVMRDLFEGLTSESESGEVIPGVAESWDFSPDTLTYTFHLRHNARWSNGDAVTAEDFAYSLRRALDPKTLSRYTFILSPIVNADAIAAGKLPTSELGVRALDDYTLEIRLAHPTPYFLSLLAHETANPVNRANVEQFGAQFTRPGNLVGNGAYRLAEWTMQSHLKLVRNPYYWDDAHTTLNEVWFHVTEDLDAELKRFRAGELDWTYKVPGKQLPWIRENMPDELKIAPYLGSYYYAFNVTRPPFKDNPKLRRALALAIDRDIITKEVLGFGEIPAFGWVPPVIHYTPQSMPEASWTQEAREAEAKRLYAEAGYSPEHPLKTELMYNTEEDHRRIAVAIASMWQRVLGVETSITNQEWKVFIDTREQKIDTQVVRDGWIGDYNDAYTFAELLRSNSQMDDSGYKDKDYDALLDRAQRQNSIKERAALLEEAERKVLTDMPILPIYFYASKHMVRPWVKGWEPNILDHHRHKNFYLLKH
jgi:oligopeptide transport system substrate-binding protein